jgi:hypothetical protein
LRCKAELGLCSSQSHFSCWCHFSECMSTGRFCISWGMCYLIQSLNLLKSSLGIWQAHLRFASEKPWCCECVCTSLELQYRAFSVSWISVVIFKRLYPSQYVCQDSSLCCSQRCKAGCEQTGSQGHDCLSVWSVSRVFERVHPAYVFNDRRTFTRKSSSSVRFH